jgi:hypothetical protein
LHVVGKPVDLPLEPKPGMALATLPTFGSAFPMSVAPLQFDDAKAPGQVVTVEADTQAVVTPGVKPWTAIVLTKSRRQVGVPGDYRDVHLRIPAAAA